MTVDMSKPVTRKEKVLKALTIAARTGCIQVTRDGAVGQIVDTHQTEDGWVNGYLLCHPKIGGSEGLRRLRELRADGHEIEMRPHPVEGRTSRQYRLIERTSLL